MPATRASAGAEAAAGCSDFGYGRAWASHAGWSAARNLSKGRDVSISTEGWTRPVHFVREGGRGVLGCTLPCPRATRPRNKVLSYSSAAGAALAAARARSAALACRFRYLPPYATVHVCERATSNTRRTLHGRGCYRKTRFVNLSVANGTAIGFLGARLNASTRASSSRLHDRSTVP